MLDSQGLNKCDGKKLTSLKLKKTDERLHSEANDNVHIDQDVEGNDEQELDMSDYPLDSLLIRSDTRTIHDVCRRIDQNSYIMDPDFQRAFVWNSKKQSRLIESLLMRIPLPVFYLAERNDGKVIVIDGLQRLTTIHNFIRNKFSLSNLTKGNSPFKGKKFKDFSTKLQNRIEDTQLILYLLDEKVPERARLDIFERVNGGTPLTRQQMRNCMYSGKGTKLLKTLAESNEFLLATDSGLGAKQMRDREVINRFMAFSLFTYQEYKGEMDTFLASALEKMNALEDATLLDLSNKFRISMSRCYKIWEKHSFRKHTEEQTKKSVINIALFDVLSVIMSNELAQKYDSNPQDAQKKFFKLCEDEIFMASISQFTNDLKQVNTRFELANIFFEE
ncbi:DUF262 domain-containing protein [Desulfovibrio litoralis]|uniref:GmrSD restriction endonucleases N-terminal domain-containing protein n=1 Tax=Desulfovibrio litoralis DSM 11393 TaxID=1121455 RepID=A0A1M7TLS7_9BACT|nr:DUF262 domain-containing protein [Desulfovibrio litoralis]SHN71699.1 Protein of unknown function DUF262 [Desulfovibrio litoralis DSM 11393]